MNAFQKTQLIDPLMISCSDAPFVEASGTSSSAFLANKIWTKTQQSKLHSIESCTWRWQCGRILLLTFTNKFSKVFIILCCWGTSCQTTLVRREWSYISRFSTSSVTKRSEATFRPCWRSYKTTRSCSNRKWQPSSSKLTCSRSKSKKKIISMRKMTSTSILMRILIFGSRWV